MTENEGVWQVFDPGDCFAHVVADARVLDLIFWLAGAFAFLLACALVYQIVVWVRGVGGRPSPPRSRRSAEVPPVVTGRAETVGGGR